MQFDPLSFSLFAVTSSFLVDASIACPQGQKSVSCYGCNMVIDQPCVQLVKGDYGLDDSASTGGQRNRELY
ncbi:hypothetical protein BX666DRAFT_1994751 [Dichotomocladium elegans]|nr:hypothetical protein BX666DRAFT_1994751 [Dichotomocladium elegans]